MTVHLTDVTLRAVMPGLPEATAKSFYPFLNAAMCEFGIDTTARVAMFLAMAAHESGQLTHLVENLNYSAAGLRKVWPHRFTSDVEAERYARKPMAIAEKVYGGRLGNGVEGTGDGWRYRGRGIFQTTGKTNYRAAELALKVPLVDRPELLEEPDAACRSAGWYWKSRGLNALVAADGSGDVVAVTKAINGGVIGLEERRKFWMRAKAVLGVGSAV